MNDAFFKFWATIFQQAAGNPALMEALARLMAANAQGMAAFFPGTINAMPGPFDATAFAAYVQQFYDWFSVAPRCELDKATARCRQLEAKLAAAEARIENLRVELAASRLGQGDAVAGFTELVKVQQHQFEQLTASIGQIFIASADKDKKR